MASFAHSCSPHADARVRCTVHACQARPLAAALGALVAAACALLVAASPARAVVENVGGTPVGLQPYDASTLNDGPVLIDEADFFETLFERNFFDPNPETFANAAGNPVLHGEGAYVVFWDPDDLYHGDWQHVVEGYLHNVSLENGQLNNIFSVDAQYTDRTNSPAPEQTTFLGAYTDTNSYPAAGCTDPSPPHEAKRTKVHAITCLSDAQIRHGLEVFIAQHGLGKGMNTIFYMLTPPGVTVCLDGGGTSGHCSDFAAWVGELEMQRYERHETKEAFERRKAEHKPVETLHLGTIFGEEEVGFIGENESYEHAFCSYHSDINPDGAADGDGNTILYAVVPWTAGGAGDGQLSAQDQNEAYFCQDGGFDPSSTPIEQHDPKVATVAASTIEAVRARLSEEVSEKKITEEQAEEDEIVAREELLRAREQGTGPHVQEPNQTKCPSADGFCDQGLADLIVNQMAIEQQNTVTNPLLDGWQDDVGNELTDECRNFFAPSLGGSSPAIAGSAAGDLFNQQYPEHGYYLNTAFDLAALKLNYPGVACLPGIALQPNFTSPANANPGEIVGFDGMDSNITLDAGTKYNPNSGAPEPAYATYSWNFGDGTPVQTGYAPGAPACSSSSWPSPCAASVYHSYLYSGTYDVSLTVKDAGGYEATEVHPITIAGSSSSSSSGNGKGGPSASSGVARTAAKPLVTAQVLSRSLRVVTKHGVVVRYSVNERLSGRVEITLATSAARKLHIKGAAATGFAAGTPAQTLIGKAFLVATKAGHSNMTIKFAQKTDTALRKLHKESFMLRIVVRNIAGVPVTFLLRFTLAG